MNIEAVILIFQLVLLVFLGLKYYRKVVLTRIKYRF
jgi:hypothetical protein